MESDIIKKGNFEIKYFSLNTLIIGSGAASLNAAICLHSMGQKDILIATSGLGSGTSNNAGSDKQTYYKLSLCGNEPDSVREMAWDLFNGKCMHGDIALCEAQGSVEAFMNLVRLGVPFPHDKFGSWVGYKTDHDPRSRATSAGPDTSKLMVKVLSGEVKKRDIKILDFHQVIELITDKESTKVIGALAINTAEKNPLKAIVLFNAVNIIMGTGGPGDIYSDSVYPLSQTCSTGMAFRAGATGQNLTETQFGIASLKFRWNLSGSYQQVIPRYFSTDQSGKDEKEFLNPYFPDYKSLTKAIFLKGYQWPFDPSKVSGFGSSLIDLLVFREREENQRKVFIDFRRNVSWKGKDLFIPDKIDPDAGFYLSGTGSLQDTPYKRLISINRLAVELYRENGIDLASEPLEIGICAQHNNGGLTSNIWWESNLKHLFPIGEVNGSHGVYRPGGAALNSGQVGSKRAAEFISRRYGLTPPPKQDFLANSINSVSSILDLSMNWLSSGKGNMNESLKVEIRKRMSYAGSIIRDRKKVSQSANEASSLHKTIEDMIGARSVKELADCFRIVDNCLTHFIYLEAIKLYIDRRGRSRGSYIITGSKESKIPDVTAADYDFYLSKYNRDVEKDIMEVNYCNGDLNFMLCKVREIPHQNLWFEKVWRDYIEDNYFES